MIDRDKLLQCMIEVEAKRIGELMFLYKDTHGLTVETMMEEGKKALDSDEYKEIIRRLEEKCIEALKND